VGVLGAVVQDPPSVSQSAFMLPHDVPDNVQSGCFFGTASIGPIPPTAVAAIEPAQSANAKMAK